MAAEIHVGDIGTVFEATLVEYDLDTDADVPLDISSATTLELLFQRASGVVVTVDAALGSDGTDGVLTYTTEDADFLESPGFWQWQISLAMPGWTGHSDTQEFLVYGNLG